MEEEATLLGAESDLTADTAPDPDESLINALSATDDDEPESGAEPEPTVETFKVKINGQEKEVTRDELIAHYQKEQAASQKLEEAETQREQYIRHQQRMAQAIEQINQQAQQWAQEGQPNWQELLETNPHEYLKQQEIYRKRGETLREAQAAQAYLQQQQAETRQAELNRHLSEESKKLADYIPEWKDKAVRERDEQELISYLTGIGYSQQDLVNLSNSRASNIALARKAMIYDRAMSKAKALKKGDPTAAAPVPTVGNRAGAGKRSIDDTTLPFDDFVKLRREQINKRR